MRHEGQRKERDEESRDPERDIYGSCREVAEGRSDQVRSDWLEPVMLRGTGPPHTVAVELKLLLSRAEVVAADIRIQEWACAGGIIMISLPSERDLQSLVQSSHAHLEAGLASAADMPAAMTAWYENGLCTV